MHLWSRNGRDWSVEFSGIAAVLKAWKLKSFVLRQYWYDANTGLWGVQGGPTIGRVVGPGRGAGPGPRSPFTPPVINPGGGCEGGSVNILQ